MNFAQTSGEELSENQVNVSSGQSGSIKKTKIGLAPTSIE